jgi:hypothetical protein
VWCAKPGEQHKLVAAVLVNHTRRRTVLVNHTRRRAVVVVITRKLRRACKLRKQIVPNYVAKLRRNATHTTKFRYASEPYNHTRASESRRARIQRWKSWPPTSSSGWVGITCSVSVHKNLPISGKHTCIFSNQHETRIGRSYFRPRLWNYSNKNIKVLPDVDTTI